MWVWVNGFAGLCALSRGGAQARSGGACEGLTDFKSRGVQYIKVRRRPAHSRPGAALAALQPWKADAYALQ